MSSPPNESSNQPIYQPYKICLCFAYSNNGCYFHQIIDIVDFSIRFPFVFILFSRVVSYHCVQNYHGLLWMLNTIILLLHENSNNIYSCYCIHCYSINNNWLVAHIMLVLFYRVLSLFHMENLLTISFTKKGVLYKNLCSRKY